MKFVSPNAEVSLAAVRELSEHAVSRPWDRQLRCTTWPRPSHAVAPTVFQPWRMRDVWGEERPALRLVAPLAAESLEQVLARDPRRQFFSL